MSLRWLGAVIDCHDARAQSRWWAEVRGGDKEAEVRRLEQPGAKVVAVGEGDLDRVIMKDPEGNGFSVVGPRG